jgi:hypothetical protein
VNDNIFDEITADLRRDRMADAWAKYGRYIIGGAVGIVLLVAAVTGYGAWRTGQQEAASARYDVLQTEIAEADADVKITRLLAFADAENNGYGALALFSAAMEQAAQGQYDNALNGFDALAGRGGLPDSLQDFAALQAAIVLLDSGGALADIESRLDDLMDDGNRLQPMAREVMALAYSAHDKPLDARDLLMQQIADGNASSLSRARAEIMLQTVRGSLIALPEAADEPEAEKGEK